MVEVKSISEFAQDSDFHGVRQIASEENGWIKRAFWILLMLGSLTILIYNTTSQVLLFLKFDHITKYDIEFVQELGFPAITICNVNKHRRTAFTTRDIALMGPHLEFTNHNIELLHPDLYPSDWVTEMFDNINYTAVLSNEEGEKEYDIADFYNRTGHKLERLVQHCQWKSDLCDKTSWITEFTHYGKCYTFNSDGNFTLRKAGTGNGLNLVLYDEESEYMDIHGEGDLGFKFLAHHPIEPPFLKELGFSLAPGFHYQVAIQRREIVALPDPYTTCERDRETKYFKNFTVPGCRIECETELIYKACGCKLVESPGDYPVCTVDRYDCASHKLLEIEQSDECLCMNPCHAIEFPFTLSFLRIRENTIEKIRSEHDIPTGLTLDQLTIVDIYFDMLASELIAQSPAYTVFSIFSDLGGNLGLWLGASVLAAAQLLDFLFVRCVACFYSVCKVKEKQENTQPENIIQPEKKKQSISSIAWK